MCSPWITTYPVSFTPGSPPCISRRFGILRESLFTKISYTKAMLGTCQILAHGHPEKDRVSFVPGRMVLQALVHTRGAGQVCLLKICPG